MSSLSVVAKSAIVGAVSVAVAMIIVTVLLIGAMAAVTLANTTWLPGGADSVTFFFGGAWIDLMIVILLSFASGFVFTFRRLHSVRQ